jgi:hypothetical protein
MVRNRAFLSALLLGCASTSVCSLDFRDVLPRVVENARVHEYSVRLDETTNAGQTVALSARYVAGACLIAALTDSRYVEEVLGEHDPDDRRAVLEALLAHEIGHCEDRRRARSGQGAPDALSATVPRVFAWRNARGALMLGPLPYTDLWSETLADAFMGAYLHRWHPERAQRVMGILLDRRWRFAHVDPGHNSARFLAADSFWADPAESLISAATRIRAQGVSRVSSR